MQMLLLMLIGFGVAAFGSLVGVGGGFLLMPILLFMYPAKSQEELTFISLCAVLVNAVAAAVNYARMKRIDYKTAAILALCTIPTAIAARFALRGIDRAGFSRSFGFVLVGLGAFIIWRIVRKGRNGGRHAVTPNPRWARQRIVDASGTAYGYAFDLRLGCGTALAGGFLGSFFGIGGGVLLVPILTQLLHFPAHVATSTSVLVVSVSALVAVATDVVTALASGTCRELPWTLVLVVGIGAFLGAQVGTRLSRRVSGRGILALLAVAIVLAGGRLVLAPNDPSPAAPDERSRTTEKAPTPPSDVPLRRP